MPAVMDVLDHHHANESGIAPVVIEGEPTELVERRSRFQIVELQIALAAAHLGISFLQNALVKALLVGEIIIDHALGRARAGRNFINAGAGETVLRKLFHGHRKNVAAHPFRIALRLPAVSGSVRSSAFGHDPFHRWGGWPKLTP